MTGSDHFLVFIGQGIGNIKTEFLKAALLGMVVDIRVNLHVLNHHPFEQVHDEKFLGLGTVAPIAVFRQGDLEGKDGSTLLFGSEPEMDGSDGWPLAQGR